MATPRLSLPRTGLAAAAALAAACSGSEPPKPDPVGPPEVCKGYAFSDSGAARVFALQPRIEPEGYASYEGFRARLMQLVDERVRPCLAKDRPNVLVFPEDLGLSAAFIGSRGEAARSKTSATTAVLALQKPYAGAIAHYKATYSDLGFAEAILLGLTDTLWRAFYETSREIATSTGAYVVASTNVSGTIEESHAAADLAALADPDLAGVESVYVARDPAVYNTAFVIAPDGSIAATARKPYLVELEESQLSLAHGALAEVRPIAIGGLRAGIVTSKDAWMPDMVDRLHILGANVLLQPEAFSGWGIEELPGDWLPEVFLQSGFAAVQKHGGLRHAAIPHLTGNLLDLVFDGQSAIVGDVVPGESTPAYIGMPPQGGFLQVAPWIIPDPGTDDPGLALDERRAVLRAAAEAALPGGDDANGYVEAVVAADLAPAADFPVAADGSPGALGASRAVAPGAGEQLFPAVVAAGERLYVAWQEASGNATRVVLARSDDGGKSFGPAAEVSAMAGEQRTPALWAEGDEVVVAWQHSDAAGRRIAVVRSADGGKSFGDVERPGGGGAGADSWGPSLASDEGRLFVAFVDGIEGNERIAVARSDAPGAWEVTLADPEPLAAPAGNPRNNQWAPAIAARNGQVAAAWVDFRNDNWDVFLGRSTDGGVLFAAPVRLDDGGDAPERLNDDPSLALRADGGLACAWTDVRLRKTPASARFAMAGDGPTPASVRLAAAPPEASTYRPRLIESAGGLVVVWQDNRTGGNDVYLSRAAPEQAFTGEARVDDGGDGPSSQFAPAAAALANDRVAVVWEDTRSGKRQIRLAVGKP